LALGGIAHKESGGSSIIGSCERSFWTSKKVTLGALVGLASFLLFVASCSGSEPSTYQPNIIFVLTDDLDFASAQKMLEVRSQLIEEG
jgi:hypothetical protein